MSRKKPKHRPRPATTSFAVPARKNLPSVAGTLIANARNDITIPYFSGRMNYVDDTLIERGEGKGLKIYDEIERDTFAAAVLEKRRKQLTAREWKVEPASTAARDMEAADFVRDVLKSLPFDRVCEELLDATLKGFAVSELVWKRDGNGIVPEMVVSHDQRRFIFDENWRPRLLTYDDMYLGEALPDRKFIVHRYGVKWNNPYGLGLGSSLFWPVLFKREGVAFWLHFLDKFAGPTVIAETPFGSLPDVERRILNSLTEARTSSAIVVPIGTNAKFLEASRSGSVTYRDFIEYWDKQISIRVTGETMTTQVTEGGGNRALGETHAEMLGLLVDGDDDLLSGTLRGSLLRWLVEYNYPGAGVPSVWRERPSDARAEAETRKAEAEAATAHNSALRAVVSTAAQFAEDDVARKIIVSSGLVGSLDDDVIDALVSNRAGFQPAAAEGINGFETLPGVTRNPVPPATAPRLPGVRR